MYDSQSERADALQKLIGREMKASDCSYQEAWARVGATDEGKKLFAAMTRSDSNLHEGDAAKKATQKEQESAATQRSHSPSGAPGASSGPPDSQAPPQILTLRRGTPTATVPKPSPLMENH